MFLVKIFSALALLSVVRGQCARSGDKYIGDLCYTISSEKLSFDDARTACSAGNENLAVIHTTLQSNFLASLVRTQTGAPEGLFWIGLRRPSTGSRFQWDDGTILYWSNFDSAFPKDNNYVAESTVNGKWRTLDGQQPFFFVCSYDPTHVTPGTAEPSTPGFGSTGYNPSSVPVTGATDYTAMSSFASANPSSDSTGYPVSESTDYPVSGSTDYGVSGNTGYPVSDSTNYLVSGSTDYPVSTENSASSEGPIFGSTTF